MQEADTIGGAYYRGRGGVVVGKNVNRPGE